MVHIAQRMSNLGYDIFASDLYGHGKSEGSIAHIPSIDD
jgi:alpha-beta hydrolase superfamily lysophospholipase